MIGTDSIKRALKAMPGTVWLYTVLKNRREGRRLREYRARFPSGTFLDCNGVRVFCDLRDATSMWYDGFQSNLELEQKAMREIVALTSGTVLVDVGAHYGFFTAYLASLIGDDPARRIIAVEPDPENFACLEKTVAELPNVGVVKAVHAAVGEAEGRIELYRTPRGACSHTYREADSELRSVVPMLSLDSLAGSLPDGDSIGFVKMDIDGSEPSLFAGAGEMLRKHRPVVMTEFSPVCLRQAGHDPREFFEQLCGQFHVVWLDYVSTRGPRVVGGDDLPLVVRTVGDGVTYLVLTSDERIRDRVLQISN